MLIFSRLARINDEKELDEVSGGVKRQKDELADLKFEWMIFKRGML